ncbi:putative nucleotidyltransferase, ribonuclease H [Tanacetum coccineum]
MPELAASSFHAVVDPAPQIREAETQFVRECSSPWSDAENWISHMEKIFDVMDCNDAFKTRLAVYKAFKELFFLQFFPRAKQERLKREYHSIRQRASENSTEYMQRFLRLAELFLGTGMFAGTAEEQAKNFRWGLHKSILDHVMCIQFTDVAQVADAARNLEILRDRDDYDRSERSDKRHKSGDRYHPYSQQGSHKSLTIQTNSVAAGRDQRNRGQQSHRSTNSGYSSQDTSAGLYSPVCTLCGRRHPGRCRSCMLFDDKIRSVNALPLDMCEFDIILGMDWLAAHRATIDCHSRRVIFGDIHAPEFIYHGSLPGKPMKIISALKARTLLSHGCEGFLATIHDTTSDVSSIHDQPIVSEFQDVFPEELPGIPPIRDVEFNIELIPGAEPISKAPYRMAPIELKELKDQLQEGGGGGELLEPSKGISGSIVSAEGITMIQRRLRLSQMAKTDVHCDRSTAFSLISRLLRRFVEKRALRLKQRLVSAPILTLPSGSGGFQIYSDASKKGLGCVLMQHGKVIAYASRQLKPYEYHPGKANVVADALSRKSGMIAGIKGNEIEEIIRRPLAIKTAQKDWTENCWASIQNNLISRPSFALMTMAFLWQGTKLCVPEDPTLREALMTEAHSSPFSIHPGSTKMYPRSQATLLVECGLLQPLEIPVWKWDEISMDFVTGLPRTQRKHDAIWVVVDRLTKSAHFLPIRKDYPVSKLAEMFQQEIVRLHGTPSAIVSDRDPRFTSRFWKGLQKAWGTRLKFSTAFHPETDGQSERTIQTLEDMLRSCALEWAGNWDDYICLVEFAYNNSWHASIKCAPFEMLYGRKCRAPICWDQVGERILEGPEMIEVTNEKVAVAREKLKEAQTRQKSYADRHRRALEFQPGEHVFLKVSPTRGVRRFGIKGKLSPRFIGPFEILDRVGEVSYRLALPPQLSHVHNVFHVSLLRGYKYHPLHVVSYPFDQIREDLSYTEEPESILDRQDRVMRNKTIPFVKILWRNHPEREATWETEESIRTSYPRFLP